MGVGCLFGLLLFLAINSSFFLPKTPFTDLPLGLHEKGKSLKKKLHNSQYCGFKKLTVALFLPAMECSSVWKCDVLTLWKTNFCGWLRFITEKL